MWTVGDGREFANAGHDAGGRHRNAIRNDVQPGRFFHNTNRFHQLIKIQERLAGSHSHQVRPARCLNPDAIRVVESDDDLLDNFAGSEISQQTKLRRQAEGALQRTAGLRREENRVPALFGNENSFYRTIIVSLEKITASSVAGNVSRLERQS